jgi:hypothetical protein
LILEKSDERLGLGFNLNFSWILNVLSDLFIKKLVLLVDVSDEDDDYEIISNQQNDTDDLESVVTYSGNRFTTNQSF